MTTSSRLFRAVSVLSIAGLIASCGLLKKKGDEVDASAEAAVAEVAAVEAGPAPVAAPVAANVADVARFPDEKALDNVVAPVLRVTNVREIPNIGKLVATLQKGGTVTQIASRTTFFLVVFENPKDQKKLMGWVPADAFTAAPVIDASVRLITCTPPDVPLISDGPFCGRLCSFDADCPAGQACKGAANKFTNNRLGDAVTVCTVFNRPTVVTTVATNVPPPPPPPPVIIPIPNADISDPVQGKCPVGFSLVGKDLKCHKVCLIGQCRKETTFCVDCAGIKVCSGNRDLCK